MNSTALRLYEQTFLDVMSPMAVQLYDQTFLGGLLDNELYGSCLYHQTFLDNELYGSTT